MIKDIGKAAYWIVVLIIAFVLVSIGVNILFSAASIFIAIILAPVLLTKAAASGAEIETPAEPKTDNSNAAKFNIMK